MFYKSTYLAQNGKANPEYLVTHNGCKAIIDRTRNNAKGKQQFIEFVNTTFGSHVNTVYLQSRPEECFMEGLGKALQAIGYTLQIQYYVDGYRLDGYIPVLNIAVEYDEDHHCTPTNVSKDLERQRYIIGKLGCTFVRCRQCDSDGYNVGLVFKEIMKLTA